MMEAPHPVSQISAEEDPLAKPGRCKRRRLSSEAPEPVRKSRRSTSRSTDSRGRDQLPSPSHSRTPKADYVHPVAAPSVNNIINRKRKAETAIESIQSLSRVPTKEPSHKRPRTGNEVGGTGVGLDRIGYWIQEAHWPYRDFEPDPNMSYPLVKRPRSQSSQGRQSDIDTPVPSDGSDQISRAQKGATYAQPGYMILLEFQKSYLDDSKAGILPSEKEFCRSLLTRRQAPPSATLFDDECFNQTFLNLRGENEARVVLDLLRLIVPSVENLAARGASALECLKEHTNAGWNESIPVVGPRPQPDFCVGFRPRAFTDSQLGKLHYHLRSNTKTYFSVTPAMFFPFLTAEVKGGKQALEIAERQNAHSMTVAIRGITELFRKVGRANELHRKALGFSILHDHETVKIYVHYPEIDGSVTECYRHALRKFDLTDDDGKERWTAYQFVRNVYDLFVPLHLKRIQDAIDQLPDPVGEPPQPMFGNGREVRSQEMIAPSIPSSQQSGSMRPPTTSSAARGVAAELRRQNTEMQARIDRLIDQNEQQRLEAKQERDKLLEMLTQRLR